MKKFIITKFRTKTQEEKVDELLQYFFADLDKALNQSDWHELASQSQNKDKHDESQGKEDKIDQKRE